MDARRRTHCPNRTRPALRTTTLAALAAVLLVTAVAPAQVIRPPAGMREALLADFARRDLTTMSQVLRLEDDQAAIIEALYDDYAAAFEIGVGTLRLEIGAARPDMAAVQEQIREERKVIDEQMRRLQDEVQQRFGTTKDREARRSIMEEYRSRQLVLKDKMSRYDDGSTVSPLMLVAMRDMERLVESWAAEKAVLRATFVSNVQAILTDEQNEKWPVFERRLRREKSLPRGQLSGESTDLILLIRMLDLDPHEMEFVASLLDEYSLQLEGALVTRDRHLDSQHGLTVTEFEDPDLFVEHRREEVRLRAAVRDVNVEYARQLAEALPDAPSAEFAHTFRHRAFTRIYRPSPVLRMLTAALERPDFSAEAREAFADLRAAYLVEFAAANETLQALVVAHEPDRLIKRHGQRVGPREDSALRAPDPISLGYEARDALDARYLEQMAGILTPEALRTLPGASDAGVVTTGGRGTGLTKQRWIMERFDEDGDGKLDRDERDKLRAYLREENGRSRE